jgi:metal-dependent amidase/aminoacylase/carboxypeptidase family protein
MSSEDRLNTKLRLEEIVRGICTAMRGSYEVDIEESYPCLYNDDDMVELLRASAKEAIGEENVLIQPVPRMWVESFAYFANERPACFYMLGCGNVEKGITAPIHNANFDIDEQCLSVGVAVQCQTAFNYLTR